MTTGRCVCGHTWQLHDVDDEAGCEACGCRVFLDVALPGQVALIEGT